MHHVFLMNILGIFVGIEMGSYIGVHETNFETFLSTFLLHNSTQYYSRKKAIWISKNSSYYEYMVKAQECLKREKESVGLYLYASNVEKLLEKLNTSYSWL